MTGKIALEEHFAIPETLDDSVRYSPDNTWSLLEQQLLDLQGRRIADMDANGIGYAILSLNAPAIQGIGDTARAVAVAKRANDVLAQAVESRPDRFGGLAALPMQDPEAATGELTRCVDRLGFVGALVNGFSELGGDRVQYYDDPRFERFWARVEELDVPFYLHVRDPLPSRAPVYDGHPWFMGSAWAFGAEAAVHALRLMGCGLFDRHPRLRIILGHLGEGLPFMVWRLDNRLKKSPRGIPAKRTMSEYLRTNFYVTTSGQFRTSSMIDAIAEMGVDRVLFSADYPFENTIDASTWFDNAEISEGDRLKIGRGNAAALFKLAMASNG